MNPELIVCFFLSLALAVASLVVVYLQRQRRGLQEILQRVIKEFHRTDDAETECPDLGSDALLEHDRVRP